MDAYDACVFSGDRLKTLRVERDLSQADLARKADVYKDRICQWENGKATPRAQNVVKLARALSVGVTAFDDRPDARAEGEAADGEAAGGGVITLSADELRLIERLRRMSLGRRIQYQALILSESISAAASRAGGDGVGRVVAAALERVEAVDGRSTSSERR